jgi:Calx-beta domain
MKPVTRLLTAAATVALGALALVPTAQAAGPTFSVLDGQAYEYRKDCSTQGPPFPCTTSTQTMYVEIWTSWPVSRQVTFGYQIEPITATQGADYTGTTGTVVMAARTNFAFIAIPVILDSVAEPSETLRVRLTSSSIGGNISDTGIGTILNDGQIPADCTLSRPSLMVTSLACAGRPPAQRWYVEVTCYDSGGWGYIRASGEIVTGNGTSVAECTRVDYDYGYPYFYVRP